MTNRTAATRASQLNPNAKYRLDTSYRSKGFHSTPPATPAAPRPYLTKAHRLATAHIVRIKIEEEG